MKSVSIAMTTYCGEKYVGQQLSSLLGQSRKADSVIICDDNSVDNTAQIVACFIEANCLSNWHFIVNDKNIGYRENFKKAISMCDGDIVFLCDQDDVWHSDKLEKMIAVFEENPNVKALNTSFDFIDDHGKAMEIADEKGKSNHNLLKREVEADALEKISFAESCTYNFSPGCTMAFTAELGKLYLSETKCIAVHDWEINFAASISEGCFFWNKAFIDYRIHSKNAIGIPGVGSNKSENRGSLDYRYKNAVLMEKYTKSFNVYENLLNEDKRKILISQMDFLLARKKALNKKNLFSVFALNKYYKNYKNSVTFKGRIADLLCVIKG